MDGYLCVQVVEGKAKNFILVTKDKYVKQDCKLLTKLDEYMEQLNINHLYLNCGKLLNLFFIWKYQSQATLCISTPKLCDFCGKDECYVKMASNWVFEKFNKLSLVDHAEICLSVNDYLKCV